MNTENPTISIVTAVRNGADYLPALIESVLAQDYPHYEHIVIDDGSTDDGATATVLERYEHLRWWSRENRGQYATQNEGIAAASGDVIVVISADDVFITPDAFRAVVEYWREHPDCELVYGDTLRMDETGALMPDVSLHWPPSRWLMRQLCYVAHCSLFISADFLRQHDIHINPKYRYSGDWEWLIRLFHATDHIGYINRPLSVIRLHSGQISRRAASRDHNAERREISAQHGGSYTVNFILRQFVIIRALTILAWHKLRTEGPGELFRAGRRWIARRLGRSRPA
jgi:glycosyltransferase involved in cell wall biosynthesis